jgi:hypothetical protein
MMAEPWLRWTEKRKRRNTLQREYGQLEIKRSRAALNKEGTPADGAPRARSRRAKIRASPKKESEYRTGSRRACHRMLQRTAVRKASRAGAGRARAWRALGHANSSANAEQQWAGQSIGVYVAGHNRTWLKWPDDRTGGAQN